MAQPTHIAVGSQRANDRTTGHDDDNFLEVEVRVRAVLWGAFGYFLLDLAPLVAPTKSALDVGQSIGLLFTMGLFHVICPIDSRYKFSATQVVLVVVMASTGLDLVDFVFNVNFSDALSAVPALFDMCLSVCFMCWLGWHLHRANSRLY